MKKTRNIIGSLAIILSMSVGTSSLAQAACLSDGDLRQAVSSGSILPLEQILVRNSIAKESLVSVPRVCDRNGALHYELNLLKGDQASTVWFNAVTGAS